jgi:hypothetical protein
VWSLRFQGLKTSDVCPQPVLLLGSAGEAISATLPEAAPQRGSKEVSSTPRQPGLSYHSATCPGELLITQNIYNKANIVCGYND